MTMNNRVAAGTWGESKQRLNIMLTPTATEKVDKLASKLGITRSECLERIIRSDCIKLLEKQENSKPA